MFQHQFQAMEDGRGGGGGYGEVLAPVWQPAGGFPNSQPHAVSNSPGGGGGGGGGGYARVLQSGYTNSQGAPQYTSQYPAQAQPVIPQYPQYSPPPQLPLPQAPAFDSLMPNGVLPELPAGLAPSTPPRRSAGSSPVLNGPGSVGSPQGAGQQPCEYCGTRGQQHPGKHSHAGCRSAFDHVRTCPSCSKHLKRDTRFFLAVIGLLLVIVVILFLRLRGAQRALPRYATTSLGKSFSRKRQPYLEASRLGRLLQE
jgi:hypothetical protein